MKKPQRFLSLRKIAAIFPLDATLSIVKLDSLPQSLQTTIKEYVQIHSTSLDFTQHLASSQDLPSFHDLAVDYVLVWLTSAQSISTQPSGAGAEIEQMDTAQDIVPLELVWGWQLLSKLSGALHLTESFFKANPLFKYITVGLDCEIPSTLLSFSSPEILSQLLSHLNASAYWVLSLSQGAAEVQRALKQDHIDIRLVTSTDEADAHIGSMVLTLSTPLKGLINQAQGCALDKMQSKGQEEAQARVTSVNNHTEATATVTATTSTSTITPASSSFSYQPLSQLQPLSQFEHIKTEQRDKFSYQGTGVLYLDRLQRALATIKDTSQMASLLPSDELPQAEYYMSLALQEAQKAFDLGEIPVGAVLVDSTGEVLARGCNLTITTHDITSHAEMEVFRQAGVKLQNHRLNDLTLYVTLEPCCMCAMAAIHARIKRIVYGASEPKTGACGSKFSLAQDRRHNHQLEVYSGVLADKCRKLLQDFFMQRRGEL